MTPPRLEEDRDAAAPLRDAASPTLDAAAPSGDDAGADALGNVPDSAPVADTLPGTQDVASAGRCLAHGLAAGLYLDGQAAGSPISEAQARGRLQLIAPYTRWVRFYSALGGHGEAACIAKKELGLEVALGAWLARDAAANDRELAALIEAAKRGCVDIAIIGSEVLLRRDLTASALIAHLRRVKAAVPAGVRVGVADTYTDITPEIIAASDVVLAHIYPFWEYAPLAYGVAQMDDRYRAMKAKAGNKPVIVAETGWPSAGRGDATPEAAAHNLAAFMGWARANDVPYFYFAAFDEKWKTEAGVGPHWGVFSSDGKMKPGFDRAFRCEFPIDDPNAGKALVGGEGTPAIQLVKVPPIGSMALLEGRVRHVRPVDHRVVVYIQVAGRWWVKPTAEAAATRILPDGTWQVAVATGGQDAQAPAIRAYLLPADIRPPPAAGLVTLPATLAAYPMAEALR